MFRGDQLSGNVATGSGIEPTHVPNKNITTITTKATET
jgi:hypothetical protein